jgi:glycosyltransferase involved in cell wall biosynthesis
MRSQTFTDWELVVVDDGSTDETRAIIAERSQAIPQRVRYIYQPNQGAYGARNTGLTDPRGRYIAFFDSDDVWLPHHLRNCVAALEEHPTVDWVYAASRIVEHGSGRVIVENTFYPNRRPRPFLKLKTISSGSLHVIRDARAVRWMIGGAGLQCGLQTSVIRRTVFDHARFSTAFRNEAEDRLFALAALSRGHVFGYFDAVHVLYCVHDQNSSAAARVSNVERDKDLHLGIIRGYEELPNRIRLSRAERTSLRRRLSREYFWHLGYGTLWLRGQHADALEMFRRGIALHPTSLRYWKTYWLSRFRAISSSRRIVPAEQQAAVPSAAASAHIKK